MSEETYPTRNIYVNAVRLTAEPKYILRKLSRSTYGYPFSNHEYGIYAYKDDIIAYSLGFTDKDNEYFLQLVSLVEYKDSICRIAFKGR